MLEEKRKHKRFDITKTLNTRICRKDGRTLLTGEIPVASEDISRGGMRLRWPKSWQCSKCNKCLGWVFNHDCRFKNTETNKINRDIDEEILLKVTIDSKDIAKDVFMKVVWTSNTDESRDYYDVGLNFVKKDRDAEEAISVIISKEKK
jgi:hypothetical protein